jgi:hypothetical protein
MISRKFDQIPFDKTTLKEKTKKLKSTNSLEDNEKIIETKRKELVEEYKILQSKIDSYGTVLIRVRGMMISLVSAILFFTYEAGFADSIWIKITVIVLIAYMLYNEFINDHVREVFQKRIYEIEIALKSNSSVMKENVFCIAEISRNIHAGFLTFFKYFHKDIQAYYRVFVPIVAISIIFLLVDLKNSTKQALKLVVNNTNNYLNCYLEKNQQNELKLDNHSLLSKNTTKPNLMNEINVVHKNQIVSIDEINNSLRLQVDLLKNLSQCLDCNILNESK